MPTIVDLAMCIRSWDFSETSQTVSLLTREHGVIRGLAKGARREKGNFSGGLDVLTRGEVIVNVKPGRDLSLITAWHLQDMYRHVRSSLHVNRAAQYMVDLVHHMLIEHDPHPDAFDALATALEAMQQPSAIESALLQFQWALLNDAGYRPEVNRDALTGNPLAGLAASNGVLVFNARAGGLVNQGEANSADGWKVRRETVEVLRSLAEQHAVDQVNADLVRRANRLLAAYCREIIGGEPPSMRWAFSDSMT